MLSNMDSLSSILASFLETSILGGLRLNLSHPSKKPRMEDLTFPTSLNLTLGTPKSSYNEKMALRHLVSDVIIFLILSLR